MQILPAPPAQRASEKKTLAKADRRPNGRPDGSVAAVHELQAAQIEKYKSALQYMLSQANADKAGMVGTLRAAVGDLAPDDMAPLRRALGDVPGMLGLYRHLRMEFLLSAISFFGVAFVGVIEGIVITILLALAVLVWNAWHPHYATLVRVGGLKGFHDVQRHPEGRSVPGLQIFRWDAQLFFANAEIFRHQVLQAVQNLPTPPKWLIVAADAITDIDITAADSLRSLHEELQQAGVELHFAGLKGPVKDRLAHYGLMTLIGEDRLSPTVGSAVNRYRSQHPVDWKDWDEL